MEDSDIFERFGLVPRSEDLPEIRARLVAATDDDDYETYSHELLRALSVLLFAAGDPRDALLIWEAKMSSFDASCSIDFQLLCGAGLEATMAFLRDSSEAEAKEVLEYIEAWIADGAFEGFTPTEQLSLYRRYYELP